MMLFISPWRSVVNFVKNEIFDGFSEIIYILIFLRDSIGKKENLLNIYIYLEKIMKWKNHYNWIDRERLKFLVEFSYCDVCWLHYADKHFVVTIKKWVFWKLQKYCQWLCYDCYLKRQKEKEDNDPWIELNKSLFSKIEWWKLN